MSSPGEIRREVSAGVMTLRIARESKKNALTRAMYAALIAALDDAENDAAVGAVMLCGAGECFTAGNDLADFQQRATDAGAGPSAALAMVRRLAVFEKPVVAAVRGVAVGVGTTLLLHCDLVYAGESARLSTPFVDLGLTPEAASSLLLPQRVGMVRAAQMLLLADPVGAEQAAQWGLVNSVLTDSEVDEAALAAARALAGKPREAMRLSKRLLRDAQRELTLATIDREAGFFSERLHSAETRAALERFFRR